MQTRLFFIALAGLVLGACWSAPTGLVVRIEPALPTTGETLVAVAELPEGSGEVEVVWSWFRDGEEQADLAEQSTVPAGRTAAGESWRVMALPIANSIIGETAEAEVVVGAGEPCQDWSGTEPNDSPDSAHPLAPGYFMVDGAYVCPTDHDYFSFDLTAGSTFSIGLAFYGSGGEAWLLDPGGGDVVELGEDRETVEIVWSGLYLLHVWTDESVELEYGLFE